MLQQKSFQCNCLLQVEANLQHSLNGSKTLGTYIPKWYFNDWWRSIKRNLFFIKFWNRRLRRRDFIRPAVVEHRAGNGARFGKPEVSRLPQFRFQDALLLEPEAEPRPEAAHRLFGAIVSAQFGRIHPENRTYDLRQYQSDQIWRNFATLAKFWKSFGNVWGVIDDFTKLWTCAGKCFMLLGKFKWLEMAKY